MYKLRLFTLLELLVVISIISILAGILMPALFTVQGKQEIEAAKNDIKLLDIACESYKMDIRQFPVFTFSDLTDETTVETDASTFYSASGAYLSQDYLNIEDSRRIGNDSTKAFMDPWQMVWCYDSSDGKGYKLASVGPDGLSTDGVYDGVLKDLNDSDENADNIINW